MRAALRVALLDPRAVLDETRPLVVPPRSVHLWAIATGADAPDAAALRARCERLLDAADRERAARMLFAAHRHDFLVSHAVLRGVLARYVGVAPDRIEFTLSAAGKPATTGVEFNLSHSRGRALLAVSAREPIGADLELERADVDVLAIAGRYFHGAEFEAVRAAALQGEADGRRAFFRHWVAKEAVLKGAGHGLGFPLDRFGVHFDAGGGGAGVVMLDAGRIAPDWRLHMLEVGEACPGAVAVRGPDWQIVPAGRP